jgi:hypothetical protein
MKEFDLLWENLQANLKPGTKIKIWNPYNGYLPEELTILNYGSESISIDPPRVWDSQVISKGDFNRLWEVWGDYLALRLERSQIRSLSTHHKYIISILYWYDSEISPGLQIEGT